MLRRAFRDRRALRRLRSTVLGNSVEALAAHLFQRGLSRAVIRKYIRAAGHFAHWLEGEGVPASEIGGDMAERFLEEQGADHGRAALDHLLCVLRAKPRSKSRKPANAARKPGDPVLDEYERYLRDVRGLAPSTCEDYRAIVQRFLGATFGEKPTSVGCLTPEHVVEYVTARVALVKPGTTRHEATVLRGFFRSLQLSGLRDTRLAESVPTVANWRLSHLPRFLAEDELRALLASFDRSTPLGRRGYAIALCLARLGLRSCEVAGLTLEDLDWRAATIRIKASKVRRMRLLPLPADVGRAVAAYLRHGRPPSAERRLFLQHRPPHAPLEAGAVQHLIPAAFRRVGLPEKGAHTLRHTAATRLLRAGASLKEVADVLGHRSLDTTTIYAKVDLPRLAAVALPWPEAGP
jgi:site-specific recombinase XerD